MYHPGKENPSADALSWYPVAVPVTVPESTVNDSIQIAEMQSSLPTITDLLNAKPITAGMPQNVDLAREQQKDSTVNLFLTNGTLLYYYYIL